MPGACTSLKRACALALIVGHLLAVAMAASPRLHHWAHDDANCADHACAITAILAGQIDEPGILAVSPTPPAAVGAELHFFAKECRLEGAIPHCGRERAPPVG